MKRLIKVFANLTVAVLACMACFCLTACEDLRTIEITFEVYNTAENVVEEKTLSVTMYRHLAPETVDAITGYAKDGYYDGAVIYQNTSYSSQIMLGSIISKDGELTFNEIKPEIKGEFKRGGTVGSDLTNVRGSVGLWRTWTVNENGYKTNGSTTTGRAEWFMPTSSLSNYNGEFCVFAKIDLDDETNSDTFTDITTYVGGSNRTSYTVYYTGEYDETKVNDNFGLTGHIVKTSDYEEPEDLFTAEGNQYVEYNKKTINVPTYEKANVTNFGVVVKSVKVK